MEEKEYIDRLRGVEDRAKSNTLRINELSGEIEAVNRLATAVEVMATKQDTTNKSVDELAADVKTLREKPGKRWDSIVEKVLLCVVAALVAAALAKMGGGVSG